MSSVIVGTAGHIDHGKTSLIRALTGIDTDRLPEEKRRGITIDLGFADMSLGKLTVGFIDVPGHERFIKNMLAGAHGIDIVVLVVAADEGVMPQTIEHFEICRLLGVKTGLIAITKVDTVDAELLELVSAEIEELVKGSFLEGAPMLPVSAKTGAGIETLKSALKRIASTLPSRASALDHVIPRLPIDRSFSVRGFGTVVTGTLLSGRIDESVAMELLPGKTSVRIRGVQVHGSSVKSASAGQRAAVNLGGVDLSELARGMTLAPAGVLRPTQIIDTRCEILDSLSKPLGPRARVRVHLGTAELLARIRAFETGREIQGGDRPYVQLRFESPVVALPGDRFILRSYSPSQTIGGGVVLDTSPVKLRSRIASQLAKRLDVLSSGALSQQIASYVELAGSQGLDSSDLIARTGFNRQYLQKEIEAARAAKLIDEFEDVFVPGDLYRNVRERIVGLLTAFHRQKPDERGVSRESLRAAVQQGLRPEVFRGMLERLSGSGTVVLDKELIRLRTHSVALSDEIVALRNEIARVYQTAGLAPPTTQETVSSMQRADVKKEDVLRLLKMLVAEGTLITVSGDLFFHSNSINGMIATLQSHAAKNNGGPAFDIQTFKELTGISRKYAIPLLEYLDRVHITRRSPTGRTMV